MRMRYFPAAAMAFALLAAGSAAAAGDTVVLKPTVIDVGKWAEGIAYDGQFLWAAESGQRTVARIDLTTGGVLDHLRVGRLPVDMVANAAGDAFAMVNTDKLIYRLTGQRGVLVRLDGCPDAMTTDGFNLFALIEPDCSSATSRLVLVHPDDGRQKSSEDLGEWATALAASGDTVWVAHARGAALSVIDRKTFRTSHTEVADVSLWALTWKDGKLYGGGRLGDDNGAGVVVMIDPKSGSELHRALVPERVAEIAGDGTRVVAVGEKGTIWVYDAKDLTLLRTITLATGEFQPRGVLIKDNDLILSNSMQTGENGAVLIVSGWKP